MDLMRKRVAAFDGRLQVVIQIVDMQRTVAEAPARRDVEISDHLVDPEPAFDPAALPPLRV